MSHPKEDNVKLSPKINDLLLKVDPNVKPEELNFKSLDDVWYYLKKEEQKVDAELIQLKLRDTDLQNHMEQLHEYNKIKDITQQVFGALADLLKISVSEVHQKFNLVDSC